jgi:uncharacterized membrane protein (DUF106 family)
MWQVFIVGALGLIVSAFSFYLKRKNERKYNLKEKQREVKEKQKEMKELMKDASNPKTKEKIDKLQKEVMDASMSMMKGNMGNMLYLFVIGIVVLIIVQAYYLTADFPVGKFLGLSPALVWYILVAIVSGFYYSLVFKLLEKKNIIEG